MKKLFLICLFSAVSLNANTYQVVHGNFTWHEAKADAESRGGHLVTIETNEEEQKLKNLFPLLISSNLISWAIGATTENGGSWITGESATYMPWRTGYGPGYYSNLHKYGEWHQGGMRNMKNDHNFNGYILEIEIKQKKTIYTYPKSVPTGFSMLNIPFSYKGNTVTDIFGALHDFTIYEYKNNRWIINSYDSDFEEWGYPSHFLPAGTAVWILNNSNKTKTIHLKGHQPKHWKKLIEISNP